MVDSKQEASKIPEYIFANEKEVNKTQISGFFELSGNCHA